jgi:NAD(P)-dependent dehydrogenase (short-subunit alcohol dehydrogenase family)
MSADAGVLDGKVALVTGGSRGLGREMVLAFAQAGADVVIASRKVESCEALADEVSERTGRKALAVGAHVGDWSSIETLVDQAYDVFGRVDVLVNNAGIAPTYPSLAEAGEDLWDKTFAVNVKGPFRLIALVGPRMREAGGGSIINVSSIASVRPVPDFLPYAASKAALNTLTQGFASAYGPTVRVNCIMAGPFLTDISSAWDMEAFDRDAQHIPLGRAGRPEELVGSALYLASDASSYTTGVVLPVDGGRSAAAW